MPFSMMPSPYVPWLRCEFPPLVFTRASFAGMTVLALGKRPHENEKTLVFTLKGEGIKGALPSARRYL